MPGKKSARKAVAEKKTAKRAMASKTSAKKAAAKKSAKKAAGNSVRRPTAKKGAAAKDWRETTLARVRALVREALPDVVEERKWRKPTNPDGVPTWSHGGGILLTGETYKDKVKLTFAAGAALPDRARLFNAGFDGNTRRAIDLREGDVLDEAAFRELVQAAAALNASRK